MPQTSALLNRGSCCSGSVGFFPWSLRPTSRSPWWWLWIHHLSGLWLCGLVFLHWVMYCWGFSNCLIILFLECTNSAFVFFICKVVVIVFVDNVRFVEIRWSEWWKLWQCYCFWLLLCRHFLFGGLGSIMSLASMFLWFILCSGFPYTCWVVRKENEGGKFKI